MLEVSGQPVAERVETVWRRRGDQSGRPGVGVSSVGVSGVGASGERVLPDRSAVSVFEEVTGLDGHALHPERGLLVILELDADGSGYLDAEELGVLFKNMRMPMGQRELDDIVDEIDVDGNGA